MDEKSRLIIRASSLVEIANRLEGRGGSAESCAALRSVAEKLKDEAVAMRQRADALING